jgi:glycopeptide antibiotics resistance protein
VNPVEERDRRTGEQPHPQAHAGRRWRVAAAVLLTLYVALILWLTLLTFQNAEPVPNALPFRAIARSYQKGGREFLINVGGNFFAFVPIGVLLPMSRRQKTSALRVLLFGALFSGAIEILQLASGCRVADVDDVLLNAAGALGGYAVFQGVGRLIGLDSING